MSSKNILNLIYIISIVFIIFSCGETSSQTSPCDNVNCSDKGQCYIDNGYARCACQDGYYERGETCQKYSCLDGYELVGTNCIKTCQDCQGKESYFSNPCETRDCSGNGYCTSDLDRAIYCLCYPGYKNEAGISCVESDCDGVSCASK